MRKKTIFHQNIWLLMEKLKIFLLPLVLKARIAESWKQIANRQKFRKVKRFSSILNYRKDQDNTKLQIQSASSFLKLKHPIILAFRLGT